MDVSVEMDAFLVIVYYDVQCLGWDSSEVWNGKIQALSRTGCNNMKWWKSRQRHPGIRY